MPEKDKKNDTLLREKLADRVRFEVYGQEMLEKMVRASGNSGRVYLPTNWVGCQVKIIRVD
jgi:putative transposon-encoded protein